MLSHICCWGSLGRGGGGGPRLYRLSYPYCGLAARTFGPPRLYRLGSSPPIGGAGLLPPLPPLWVPPPRPSVPEEVEVWKALSMDVEACHERSGVPKRPPVPGRGGWVGGGRGRGQRGGEGVRKLLPAAAAVAKGTEGPRVWRRGEPVEVRTPCNTEVRVAEAEAAGANEARRERGDYEEAIKQGIDSAALNTPAHMIFHTSTPAY